MSYANSTASHRKAAYSRDTPTDLRRQALRLLAALALLLSGCSSTHPLVGHWIAERGDRTILLLVHQESAGDSLIASFVTHKKGALELVVHRLEGIDEVGEDVLLARSTGLLMADSKRATSRAFPAGHDPVTGVRLEWTTLAGTRSLAPSPEIPPLWSAMRFAKHEDDLTLSWLRPSLAMQRHQVETPPDDLHLELTLRTDRLPELLSQAPDRCWQPSTSFRRLSPDPERPAPGQIEVWSEEGTGDAMVLERTPTGGILGVMTLRGSPYLMLYPEVMSPEITIGDFQSLSPPLAAQIPPVDARVATTWSPFNPNAMRLRPSKDRLHVDYGTHPRAHSEAPISRFASLWDAQEMMKLVRSGKARWSPTAIYRRLR